MNFASRVYLSEHMTTRLAETARRSGHTKSALVEAALHHFFGGHDDIGDANAVSRRLVELNGQVDRLNREIKIMSETLAHHVRFHLAVTAEIPPASVPAACRLGSVRFEEFAVQVARRIDLGTSLMRETIDRCVKVRPISTGELVSPERSDPASTSPESNVTKHVAAVREDGSNMNFPGRRSSLWH